MHFLPVFALMSDSLTSHDHIDWATLMGFASINPTNPRTDLWNFCKKISRIGHFEKSAILNFFLQKKFFFCFILMKISPNSYGRLDGSKFWRFPWFPASFLLCVIKRYTVYLWLIILKCWFCLFVSFSQIWHKFDCVQPQMIVSNKNMSYVQLREN